MNKNNTTNPDSTDKCPECEGTIFDYHRKRAQTTCTQCGLVLTEPYNYVKGIRLTPVFNYDYYTDDLETELDYWFREPIEQGQVVHGFSRKVSREELRPRLHPIKLYKTNLQY